jgi:aminoglycoside phosphotransferase (APT) family kinase protein
MASLLARIHASTVKVQASSPRTRRREKAWEKWAPRPALWREAYGASAGQQSPTAVFIHGDYQHFNQLWSYGRLRGVVDWGSATMGCPDSDVGHCRLNLAILFGTEWAERFREAYEYESGRYVDPRWELSELLDYSPDWQEFIPVQVAGRIPVDTSGMTGRVEELIECVLRRL